MGHRGTTSPKQTQQTQLITINLQSGYNNMQLRAFQEREVTKLLQMKKGFLSWDMGLGKTAAVATIGAKSGLKRWLIIAPDNAHSVWRDEAPRWINHYYSEIYQPTLEAPKIVVEFIDGAPFERVNQWRNPYIEGCIHLRVVTIESFMKDWGDYISTGLKGSKSKMVGLKSVPGYHIPQIVIYDECRRIRSKETQAFKLLNKWLLYYNPEYLYLMSGTPGHEPKHFWTYLHLLQRNYFKSYWKFVKAFHMVDDGYFGIEINEPRNLQEFHRILNQHFSIVKEEDPEIQSQRPPLTRQLLPIQMDEDQKRLYKDFEKDKMSWLTDNNLMVTQNSLAQLTRIRQALICPAMLDNTLSVGAALVDFTETIEPDSDTQATVIFCPYTSAFPIFELYLRNKGYKHVYILQGSMGTTERDKTINEYRQNRGIILCSIMYAQAFSLEPATKCFFIGYDWDPDNNRQAEKRLHRLTTKNPIMAYYYTFRSTFDERLCEIVNIKQQHVNLTFPTPQLMKEILTP
jgi:SNF2 family DNA or RNA helicase